MNHEIFWTVYEANVQAYRSIFNASQSILLAFGAFILSIEKPFILYFIAILSLILIWIIWFPLIRARTRAVDFHKIYIDPSYSPPKSEISEKQYISKKVLRDAINREAGLDSTWRLTRIKIDIVIPVIYTFMWLAIMYAAFTKV